MVHMVPGAWGWKGKGDYSIILRHLGSLSLGHVSLSGLSFVYVFKSNKISSIALPFIILLLRKKQFTCKCKITMQRSENIYVCGL